MIRFNRWKLMSDALDLLGRAASIDDALAILREHTRALGGADGVTLARREGDEVVFVAEDAIAPLWTGRRFPIADSISGLAMVEPDALALLDTLARSANATFERLAVAAEIADSRRREAPC
jgi:hypothetical protein